MKIAKRRSQPLDQISVLGEDIPFCNESRYFGVIMDSLLRWKPHVNNSRSLILPLLVYAYEAWSCVAPNDLSRLQLVQNKELSTAVGVQIKSRRTLVVYVPVPKIEIVGESDIYVKTGSTVNLKCVITQSLEEPAYIFWYHDNERVLNYDKTAKDIRMDRVGPDTTVGTLVIYNGQRQDSGNYTCSPSNLDSASVLLHVLNGEHPAAMQRGKNSASPIPGRWWSHLSAGLGLSACVQPRNVAIAVIVLGFAGHLVAWTGS
uniref:Ig-like domain-containing protein n=1 Tax=Timema shepardi TaxID=629360 RepID=A0A7R9ALM3_TIMSH|nr:unnamed protein product [Timema shepardi]